MTQTRPSIRFGTVVLDTDDPERLAEFYNALLGWQTEEVDNDWITITGPGGQLDFQRAPDFVAPTWPDNAVPQQFHLDLRVDDLEVTADYAVSLGARRLNREESFIVFLDPSGHPFCLCQD